MSALIANGPIRRLLYCTHVRAHAVISSSSGGFIPCHDSFQRREYAAGPVKTRVRMRVPKPTVNGSRLIFSPNDVPTPKEWINSLESLREKDLTPMQCVDAAQRYVRVATPKESQWRGDLEKKHNLPPSLLHTLGLALISSHSQARWRLGTHMMRSASELGYMPSTLTLVRVFTSMPAAMFEKASTSIMYKQADQRFHTYLKANTDDPNAWTLQGIIEAKKGHADQKATEMFNRARNVWLRDNSEAPGMPQEREAAKPRAGPAPKRDDSGNQEPVRSADQGFALPPPREPRWEWEISNVLGQAKIYLKHSRTASSNLASRAKELFRVAAVELDNPHGFLMLAKLMDGPRDSPERRTYLIKAAISGEAEACTELGELEKLAAADAKSPKERAEHVLLSEEWLRLGSGEDLSAEVKAADVDDDEVEA